MNLRLNSIRPPKVSETLLAPAIAVINAITTRNIERGESEGDSVKEEGRKEKIRKHFQAAENPMDEIAVIKASEPRWFKLMMSLYIESNGKSWLPAFDVELADELLGDDTWKATKIKRAAALFFARFDTLPALDRLASKLRESLDVNSPISGQKIGIWQERRDELFQIDSPHKIAAAARGQKTFQQLVEEYSIPDHGVYFARLQQVFLLDALEKCAYGAETAELKEIEKHREAPACDTLRLGAAALRLIVTRVEKEGNRQWPQKWSEWLVRLGCDPRIGRSTSECAKWWGWATDAQWNLAVQGIIGLSLKIFFDFLDGTVSVKQWKERRVFLDPLFKQGKIIDARLVLNADCMQKLPSKMKDKWTVALLTSAPENTCIIVLHCIDDVCLVEGTHNFGLRVYHKRTPIDGFWQRTSDRYNDSTFRTDRKTGINNIHPIFVPHLGDWISKYYVELSSKYHIEWTRS